MEAGAFLLRDLTPSAIAGMPQMTDGLRVPNSPSLLSRRQTLGVAAGGVVAGLSGALAGRGAAAGPANGIRPPVNYNVYVDGDHSGSQHVDFVSREQGFTATTHMSIRVEVLFVTAFRFHQIGDSDWSNGQPVAFEYTTNNDGTPTLVSGKRVAAGWEISGPGGTNTVAGPAMVPSFWNYEIVNATSVINPENGAAVPFSAVRLADTSTTVADRTITGEGYAMNSFLVGQLWFDSDKTLQALIFTQSGHTVAVVKV
jgi:Family of unknown function (DUF6134)